MSVQLVVSPSARTRRSRACAWVRERGREVPALVVAPTLQSAQELVRDAASEGHLGWRAMTLDRLAVERAAPALVQLDRVPATRLAAEAVCARVVAEAGEGLGRFTKVAEHPGLPGAIASTLEELRLAGVAAEAYPEDLTELAVAFDQALAAAGLADRSIILELAAQAVRDMEEPCPPIVFVDVPIAHVRAQAFVGALAGQAQETLAVVPLGDRSTVSRYEAALGVTAEHAAPDGPTGLANLQRRLFDDAAPEGLADPDGTVELLSAPGESRECTEIARRALHAARDGVPFDKMAVLLRAPSSYRVRLLEALRRAGIPAWSARGTRQPDPAGRAFLALLACKAEGLSARRFAEYLSLGVASSESESGSFAQADDELLAGGAGDTLDDGFDAAETSVPSPRRWERLLVESAVIGGRDRWERRLDGQAAHLARQRAVLAAEDGDSPHIERLERLQAELVQLREFALPLLDVLEALPETGTWGTWITTLSDLAARSLRDPERVLALLAELRPMSAVGAIGLAEVRLVLQRRLRDLVQPELSRRHGRVFVGGVEEARGMAFDLVFVPGLTERVFPQKVTEDPILLDAARHDLGAELATRDDRVAQERGALHLAVGSATARLVLSWSRLDELRARPRVPSFYGLEVLRATLGKLPGFDELNRYADHAGASRLGWPAPEDPDDAIDEAEHDLAVLRDLMHGTRAERRGAARYLMSVNPHLARALRARGRRWGVVGRFTPADGLVAPREEAREAIRAHQLDARSFSPTALQQYAQCPYKFLLYAIVKLSPREEPEHIEHIDALSRGSLIHDVQYELLTELRRDEALPVTDDALHAIWERMEPVRERVVARFEDELSPAIRRVWDDAMAEIRADLREWIRRMSEHPAWVPDRFELSFGLSGREAMDVHSTKDPVQLDCGIALRGAIDLIERGPGGIRVTDYKTGKVRMKQDAVVEGGEVLQPVLYALAAEQLFPDDPILASRLWFCTARGGFQERGVLLNEATREAAKLVVDTIRDALEAGFLPAAPRKDACRWCDYKVVCGPHEEQRVRNKPRKQIEALLKLRQAP